MGKERKMRDILALAAFLIVLSFLFNPIGASQKMGEIIHAFKQGIETGLQ
jgi:hypothetical protein